MVRTDDEDQQSYYYLTFQLQFSGLCTSTNKGGSLVANVLGVVILILF